MTELPELPPPPRQTWTPPPGGLEAAMREGRRRRHRAVGATLAVAAAAVVVTAVPLADLLPGRGSDELSVAGPGESTSAPTSTPASPPSSLSPAAFREDTDVTAGGGGDCAPASTGGNALCRYTGGTAPGTTLRPGQEATAVLGYCLPRDAEGDYVFSFRSGQEKEVVVTPVDEQDEVFRFSSTVRYVDGAHDRTLRRGQCIEWTGRWQLTTSGGTPVPAGDYVLRMTVQADEETQGNVEPPPSPRLPETVAIPVTVAG